MLRLLVASLASVVVGYACTALFGASGPVAYVGGGIASALVYVWMPRI